MTKTEFTEATVRLGILLVEELCKELENIEFNELDWCLQHEQFCPISPRSNPELKDALWIEAAGNTCCPWSVMSDLSGWLDGSTLPFLVWCYSCRFYEPDQILQENVAGFDLDKLVAILNSDSGHQLKHVNTRPPENYETTARRYSASSFAFSPSDLGIPSDRRRVYSAFALEPMLRPVRSVGFEVLFFRTRIADASMYLGNVGKDRREAEMVALAATSETSWSQAVLGSDSAGLHVLAEGDFARL